jgi:predicted N-acetyltransferase YhbS
MSPYWAAHMIDIRPLASASPRAVEALLDDAFGTDRKGRTAYRLRVGVAAIPALSFAAYREGVLVGSLQSWPVAIEQDEGPYCPLTLVGPVAVAPALQRSGIGRQLMERLLAAAAAEGHGALMMIGDPEYYGRLFGFTAEATQRWDLPGPFERRRLLARITRPGGVPLVGRIVPDPAFASADVTA